MTPPIYDGLKVGPECICGGGHSAYVDDDSPGAGHAVNCPVRLAHPYRPKDLAGKALADPKPAAKPKKGRR